MRKHHASALVTVIGAALAAAAAHAQPDEGFEQRPGSNAVEQPLPDEAPIDELRVLRGARDAFIEARDFDAARRPAEDVVADADAANYEDYARLGRIQAELGEFDAAELSYLTAIDAVRAAEGDLSITLVDLYRGLGRAYIRSARYPEAITALEQGQHITQRHLGLFNTEQTALIDDITTAYLGAGDTTAAHRMQLERLDNAVRRFGEDDLQVVPFRLELANYYQRSRLPVSAREQYVEVLRVADSRLGASDPQLLMPLRELVSIDLGLTQGQDEATRARLESLLELASHTAPPLEQGLSLAVLGDAAIVRKDVPLAHSYYRRAWQAVAASDVRPEQVFGQPSMIDFVAPLSSVDRATRSRPYSWAEIVLAFDVAADGRPSNVRVVSSSSPPGALAERYTRRVRETRFRPRLVNGEPAATANVEFAHLFRYYVARDAD